MKRILILVLAGSFRALASADEFPEPFDSERTTDSDPMPAAESAASFRLPPGFEIQVFASEPDVRNPIAMTWEPRGRLWVAENYTYAEKTKRFELSLRDRVLVLEDRDGDGMADGRTVFLDDVQMLTSVEVGRGGVWLLCPPQLLFVPDRDGDDVPDAAPEVVLDGFTVARSNYHNFANGLRWGPDGWLYGRCGHSCPGSLGPPGTPAEERVPIEGGIWRFHPERRTVEVLTHGTTNPWGHDWDEHGEGFFINTVNGHLWHLIPGAHFKESFGQDPNPLVFERLGMHADHWHYDRTGRWQDSRGGKADDFGGGHAHIGMMIYQADQWPAAYRGKLFTWNMHGRRANVERLDREGSGYVGRHEPDVFLAGDPWFRGLELSTGPDGSVFALDWSDTGECHDHTGVHRTSGRIYRITYGSPRDPSPERLEKLTPEAVGACLRDPNVWYERQMRVRLAGGAASPGVIRVLRETLENSVEPVQRLRALWALNVGGNLSTSELAALLEDPNEHIRAWAIRLLTDAWPIDTIQGPSPHRQASVHRPLVRTFVNVAATDDSGLVRLTLASTLQRLPVPYRAELATALVSHSEDAEDQNLPSMVWYGILPLVDEEPAALVGVAAVCDWPDTVRWIARAMAGRIESESAPVEHLLGLALRQPSKQASVLRGMSEGLEGWRQAPRPANWDAFAEAVTDPSLEEMVRDLRVLFGDGRALAEVREVALNRNADLAMRRAALRTLIENRAPGLRETCLQLLGERLLNITAVRGLTRFEDPEIGISLAQHYRRFTPRERPAVIDALVSRPEWAEGLLDQVAKGRIPRSDVTAYHARQVRSFGDEELSRKLSQVWGEVRETDEARRERITAWKEQLTENALAKADLSQGRAHYQRICASCHRLYGEGGALGPDLTGSGRADLDYLLENIVDPSAVMSADFRMTTLELEDGRLLSGVIAAETDRTVTLRLLNEEVTVAKEEIVSRKVAPVSMMPEGLLQTLRPEQARDLIAYLMHPRQVALPSD